MNQRAIAEPWLKIISTIHILWSVELPRYKAKNYIEVNKFDSINISCLRLRRYYYWKLFSKRYYESSGSKTFMQLNTLRHFQLTIL